MVHYLSFRSLMYQHWCQISSNIFLTCFALARLIILTAVDLASISCNITTCFACGIGSRWHSASSLRGFFFRIRMVFISQLDFRTEVSMTSLFPWNWKWLFCLFILSISGCPPWFAFLKMFSHNRFGNESL